MIIFRADGNEIICSGHIMRCLSIASAFRNLGQECLFVLADGRACSLVEDQGYKVEILETTYDNMESELELFGNIIKRLQPTLVIVDSYYVTSRYLRELKEICRLVYIDDLAMFAYPVDKLINYNIYGPSCGYSEIYGHENVPIPQLFLGSDYAPLRGEFENLPKYEPRKKCNSILISAGGADPIHITRDCIKYLQSHSYDYLDFQFHFVIGSMNRDIEQIKELSQGLQNVQLHRNVKNMKELMVKCDIVVSAAGSTLYELCACGVPTITYILADNQISGAEMFAELKIMNCLGDLRDSRNAPEHIFSAIKKLSNDVEKRKEMSKRMQEMVDGLGACRLAKKLLIR